MITSTKAHLTKNEIFKILSVSGQVQTLAISVDNTYISYSHMQLKWWSVNNKSHALINIKIPDTVFLTSFLIPLGEFCS